jgi:hypothetical protein
MYLCRLTYPSDFTDPHSKTRETIYYLRFWLSSRGEYLNKMGNTLENAKDAKEYGARI